MKTTLVIGVTLLALQVAVGSGAGELPELLAVAQHAQPAVVQLIVMDRSGKELATGNGFFVSADGKLLTSLRLIDKAKRVVAVTVQQTQVPVDGVLATDPKNDLALLKLPVSHQSFLPLAEAGQIFAGGPVAIVSSSGGTMPSVTTGTVLIVRKLFNDLYRIHIQASLGLGAGGAPVVNGAGAVIGIVRALVRDPRLYNLVVPVEAAAKLLATAGAQPIAFLPQHKSGDLAEGEIFLTDEWRQVVVALELEEWGNYWNLRKHWSGDFLSTPKRTLASGPPAWRSSAMTAPWQPTSMSCNWNRRIRLPGLIWGIVTAYKAGTRMQSWPSGRLQKFDRIFSWLGRSWGNCFAGKESMGTRLLPGGRQPRWRPMIPSFGRIWG